MIINLFLISEVKVYQIPMLENKFMTNGKFKKAMVASHTRDMMNGKIAYLNGFDLKKELIILFLKPYITYLFHTSLLPQLNVSY